MISTVYEGTGGLAPLKSVPRRTAMTWPNNRDHRFYYEVVGAGPPLVIHYGFSDRFESWYPSGLVNELKDRYTLVLFDGRGLDEVRDIEHPAATTPAARARDVVAVLDAAGIERAHFFGYARGGGTGWALARYAPERLLSLAIGGSSPFGQSLSPYRMLLQRTTRDLLRALASATESPTRERAALESHIEALRAAYQQDQPDYSALLSAIQVPVLLFAGEGDPVHESFARAVRAMKSARTAVISGMTHAELGAQLQAVAPVLEDFLAECDGRERQAA